MPLTVGAGGRRRLLEGTPHGEGMCSGVVTLALEAGAAAFVPAEHEHDVRNTGAVPLCYVYVVAPAPAGSSAR